MSDGAWVQVGIVDPSDGREVFQWHRGFAASNDRIFPRPWEEYERLAEEGRLFYARDQAGEYLALAYFRLEDSAWEIGGLMVDTREQRKGLGSVVTRLTLGHVLFEEDPLDRGERVIAHVHAENNEPRALIEALKFRKSGLIRVPAAMLPGLKANAAGEVEGDEFELVVPDTLLGMAEWCDTWSGRLRDHREVRIAFRQGISLAMWAQAFRHRAAAAAPRSP